MTDTTRIKPSHINRQIKLRIIEFMLNRGNMTTGEVFSGLFNIGIEQGIVSPPVDIKVDERGKPEYTESGDLMLFARTTHDDLSKTTGYAHYKGQE